MATLGSGGPVDPGDALGNAPASTDQLREAAFTGIRWVGMARAGAELAGLAALVVLARLVPPEGFGRAAVAAFVTALVFVFAGSALGAPLVQRPEIDERHLRTVGLLGLAGGLVLAGLTFVLAETLLVGLYDESTAELVQLAGVGFVIAGAAVVPNALLQRRLDFRRLGVIDLCATVPATLASIALAAFADLDATALVLGPLIGMALASVVAIAFAGMPRPGWDRDAAGALLRYGGAASGTSLSVAAGRNIDYATLATQLSAGQVGLYWRAYQLGVEYQGKISTVLVRLAFPLYARSRDLETIRRIRRRIVRAHAVAIFPLLAGFAATAPVLVPFVFGEEWDGAVVPAQILSVVGMLAAIQTGLGPLMNAIGKPGRTGLLVVGFIPVIVLLVIVLAPHGIVAVSIGIAVNHFLVVLASYRFLLTPYAGVPMRELIDDGGPAFVASAAMFGAAFGLTLLLEDRLPDPVVVLAAMVAALPVYLLALRTLFPASWRELLVLWEQAPLRRRPGREEPQEEPDPARSVG